jgi:uncharacterized repeat protein (TIGR01451 family)
MPAVGFRGALRTLIRLGALFGLMVALGLSASASALAASTPTVSGVVPNAGSTAGGNTVTINGTNFAAGATVAFGTTASPTVTYVSPTRLQAVAPPEATGVVDATVTSAGLTSATSASDLYAYGPPAVSGFTPASGITGTAVTITGSNFVPGAKVKFGSLTSPSVTFVSPATLTATIPNGATSAPISVTTPGGTGTSSPSFVVTLSITGLSPACGPQGTVVLVNGVGFNTNSAVAFNGTPASSVTYVSASQLKAALPSAATTGPITVTNTAAPTGTVRSRPSYTVTPFAAPTVSSFSPPSGVTDAVISIQGTNLCGASSVKFGSHAARFSIVSPTQINTTVPNGAVSAPISVTTPAGTAASPSSFIVTLSITSFSPGTGPPGTVVTINGLGFNTGSTVAFNGVASASVTYVSPDALKATVPADAPPGAISVTNTTGPTGTVKSAASYAAQTADLATTATLQGIATLGGYMGLTTTVTNNGPKTALNVVITNPIPRSLSTTYPTTFYCVGSPITTGWCGPLPAGVSCTAPSVGSGGTVTCATASLAPGNMMTVIVAIRVGFYLHNMSFCDSSSGTSSIFDPNTANNSATACSRVN